MTCRNPDWQQLHTAFKQQFATQPPISEVQDFYLFCAIDTGAEAFPPGLIQGKGHLPWTVDDALSLVLTSSDTSVISDLILGLLKGPDQYIVMWAGEFKHYDPCNALTSGFQPLQPLKLVVSQLFGIFDVDTGHILMLAPTTVPCTRQATFTVFNMQEGVETYTLILVLQQPYSNPNCVSIPVAISPPLLQFPIGARRDDPILAQAYLNYTFPQWVDLFAHLYTHPRCFQNPMTFHISLQATDEIAASLNLNLSNKIVKAVCKRVTYDGSCFSVTTTDIRRFVTYDSMEPSTFNNNWSELNGWFCIFQAISDHRYFIEQPFMSDPIYQDFKEVCWQLCSIKKEQAVSILLPGDDEYPYEEELLRAEPNEGFRSMTKVMNEVTLKNEGLEPKDLASTLEPTI
ncbi:hypothetical protein M422DRAFT_276416 [Sphaerobolus stellatus SS14]|uniref:Uncharacterized protein n=1 Tax=Sphaerobolus stellatus (strain SS14) TaxID=990650 RepID=A0A0C9UC97_SPHS4|nr:hypothetical protein M422DRAFT_276416 [Sphaerobolus stellatus SS14]